MNWKEAHLRLSSSLPVHTHYAKSSEPESLSTYNAKQFVYEGRVYESLNAASRSLHKDTRTLMKLAAEGKARVID